MTRLPLRATGTQPPGDFRGKVWNSLRGSTQTHRNVVWWWEWKAAAFILYLCTSGREALQEPTIATPVRGKYPFPFFPYLKLSGRGNEIQLSLFSNITMLS